MSDSITPAAVVTELDDIYAAVDAARERYINLLDAGVLPSFPNPSRHEVWGGADIEVIPQLSLNQSRGYIALVRDEAKKVTENA